MGWLFRKKPAASGTAAMDSMVLGQLHKAGSDLGQPHEVDNFLYFPDETTARLAADRLRTSSNTVDVAPGAKGRDWCVKAVVVVIPTPQNIAEMRARMEAVAHALKGDYDGWGAPIVPKP